MHEKYPNIENIFIAGDLETDYMAIEKLNLNKNKNVIGIGFFYYYPDEVKNEKFKLDDNEKLEIYKKYFDVFILMDEGYDYPCELLNLFNTN